MKKITLPVLFLLAFTCCCYSQASDTLAWKYIDVSYVVGGGTSKTRVVIQTGEHTTGWFKVNKLIEDETGKAVKFNNYLDCLNFLSVKGWEVELAYIETISGGLGNSIQYMHFLLKRKEAVSGVE